MCGTVVWAFARVSVRFAITSRVEWMEDMGNLRGKDSADMADDTRVNPTWQSLRSSDKNLRVEE